MYYYLDGYNLLFSLTESGKPLLEQRRDLIQFLQVEFKRKRLRGVLVFDGKVRLDEESGRGYESPLEIVYSSQGQTADLYILQQIELSKERSQITVVTNDRGLKRELQPLKVRIVENRHFIQWLAAPKKKEEEKQQFKESKRNIARLLKIFEKEN